MILNARAREYLKRHGITDLDERTNLGQLQEIMPREYIGVIKRATEPDKDIVSQLQSAPMDFLPFVLTNDSSKNPEMVNLYETIQSRRTAYAVPNLGENIMNLGENIARAFNVDARIWDRISYDDSPLAGRDGRQNAEEEDYIFGGDGDGDQRNDRVHHEEGKKKQAEEKEAEEKEAEEAKQMTLAAEEAARTEQERFIEEEEEQKEER